jgi:hypothetical protein
VKETNRWLRKVWDGEFDLTPRQQRLIHWRLTVIWFVASFPLAIAFGSLVVLVTWLSLYAIVVGHWSAVQAARTEERQEEMNIDKDDDHT